MSAYQPLGSQHTIATNITSLSNGFLQTIGLAGGDFAVSWNTGIQIFDANGNPLSTAFLSNSAAAYPAFAPLTDGGYVETLVFSDSFGEELKALRVDDPTGGVGFIGPITSQSLTTTYGYSAVAELSNGGFAVAWWESNTAGLELVVQSFDNVGLSTSSQTGLVGAVDDPPAIVQLTNGDLAVAWTSINVLSNPIVHITVLNSSGSVLASQSETAVNTENTSGPSPALASLPNGNFVAVWNDGTGDPIQGQIFDSNGDNIGPQFSAGTGAEASLNTVAGGAGPHVASLTNGDFVVSWVSSIGAQAYFQVFDENGNALGSEVQLAGSEGPVSVAPLANSEFAVVWQGISNGKIVDFSQIYAPTPTVTANNPTVTGGQTVAVEPAVYTVSGVGISEYEVWFSAPNQGAPALGSVTNNGTAIALNQGVYLTSLSGLDYTGGATAGTDEMWMRIQSNGTWGSWVQANITDPGGSGPLTVTANNPTVTDGQTVAVDPSVFSVGGSGISEYEVWFSAANQGAPALGSVTENGNAIALNQGIYLTSLGGLDYTGGATAGTDEMWMRVQSNGTWGSWVQANITDPGASTATVTANNPTVSDGQTVAVEPTVYTVSGSGISEYEVWFSAADQGAPALGSVTDNGTAIALNQGVFLTTLSGLDYTGGATAGTDEMWMRVQSNGTWGSWVQANITDPGGSGALTVTANNPTITDGQTVAVDPTVFSVSGSGISEYEIWFSAANQGAPALGSVTDNGTAIALNQGVYLTSLGGLDYTGGATAGTDEMWMRVQSNGTWGSWVQANITDPGSSGAPEAQTSNATVGASLNGTSAGQQVDNGAFGSVDDNLTGGNDSTASGWWGTDGGWLDSGLAPYQSAGNVVSSSDDVLAAGLQGADPQEMSGSLGGGAAGAKANLSSSMDTGSAGPLAGIGAPQFGLSDLTEPMAGSSSLSAPAAQLTPPEPTGVGNTSLTLAAGTALQHIT